MGNRRFTVGIIGGGSTGFNQAWDIAEQHDIARANGIDLPSIDIVIIDPCQPDQLGKGFAYGAAAEGPFYLTESPIKGHQDYRKGDGYRPENPGTFPAFLQTARETGIPITVARRKEYGEFQQEKWRTLQQRDEPDGVRVTHQQALASDVTLEGDKLLVTAGSDTISCDYLVVATGDITSKTFRPAAENFPGQVFDSPYTGGSIAAVIDAQAKALEPQNTHVVLRGSRSSAFDALHALREGGFQGKITAVSPTGQISYMARPERGHIPTHLTPDNVQKAEGPTLQTIFRLLAQELTQPGIYTPEPLLAAITSAEQALAHGETIGKLRWAGDPREEIAHAAGPNYHEVIGYAPWEKIFEVVPAEEKPAFLLALGDTILHERTNCIVPDNYRTLEHYITNGDVEIIQGCVSPASISQNGHRLSINIGSDKPPLTADFVINCVGGPAPVAEQASQNPLLQNLAGKDWIHPNENGGGFAVTPFLEDKITFGGWQGRPYAFSSLGLESYGAKICQTTERVLTRALTPTETLAPAASLPYTQQAVLA